MKVAPKDGKSTDRNHNLISWVGGQDSSVCKILGHFLPAFFSQEMPRNPNLTRFIKSEWHQKEENEQTVTIILPPGHSLHVFYKKCSETPNKTRLTKSNLRRKDEKKWQKKTYYKI